MLEIPLGLRSALEAGECVLFLGSGIGFYAKDPNGQSAPTGDQLALELAEHFKIPPGDAPSLSQIAEIVEIRRGRADLEAFVKKRLTKLEPDETLRWIGSIRWKAIYTTNYDFMIERSYQLVAKPPQNPKTISVTSDMVDYDPNFEVPIYHLHGLLIGIESPRIVITERDYSKFREPRRMLFELLKKEFGTSVFLYIGYSNTDPNWRLLLDESHSEFFPSTPPLSYRIAPQTSAIEREILVARHINSLDCDMETFVGVASSSLAEGRLHRDAFDRMRAKIPADFLQSFDKSPAPVSRFLRSWVYVNDAPYNELPNIRQFLRGDLPNWALIGNRRQFQRDIEDELYDNLLTFAVDSSSKPRISILLAPAGYGVSTVLMSLAVRLYRDGAKGIFFLRPGSEVLEGDIEFAVSLFPEQPFFFIDSAAEFSSSVHNVFHRFRESDIGAMFVLGERLNEWRQGHGRLNGREYEIESLSDSEIERLLNCLSEERELGALADLNREMQFAVVKGLHGKELLVTMREATEGMSFDAILEDEFRSIQNELSKRLYLFVCCFHQFGAHLRESLLAELLDSSIQQLHEETKGWLDGVVIYDSVGVSGTFGARARHRTIADIVWERCAEVNERESLIHRALTSLNLNYGLDKRAFESFVRADKMVDSLESLEKRIGYFDTACQKDPDSPYVLQHYARMLMRAGYVDLALPKIDCAIELNPDLRVLHHTRGVILSRMAILIESEELARKRLAQSEASYRRALSMYGRDEYAYHGLAELYLDWAKRSKSTEESAAYIAKTEETIAEALKLVRTRDRLWIVSANVSRYLGDHPGALRALAQAVAATPESVIARYLLGRAYRQAGDPRKAVDVLTSVILSHHDEYRSFVEYARSQVEMGASYPEIIAVLRLSTRYGFSDPEYVALLGGLLFLDGQISEANKVFLESGKHSFTGVEMRRIYFSAPDPADRTRPWVFRGKVIAVKAGYAFVESDGYPHFFCHGSRFDDLLLIPGLTVKFVPSFSPRGAIADKLIAGD
jgi:tetratricopeptide (TPR) repeat protein